MMINTPFYQVGSEIFFNKFKAFIRSKETNTEVKFNIFDSAFDTVLWEDPAETWNQLLDRRALQIASKGKPIILNFSGGTDSYTIYQVFKRNNIKLYAIHLRLKPLSSDNFQGAIDFLKKENPDTRLLIIEDDVEVHKSFYNSPEWIWNLSKLNFSISLSEAQDLEKHHAVHNLPDDYIQVLGFEKPRLKIIGNKFYSYQPDTLHEFVIGKPRIEYFFINPDLPELHVKQSYMLAKFIKKRSSIENRPLEWYNSIHDPRTSNYYSYSLLGCGRFGDLVASNNQKVQSYSSTLIIPDNNINNAQFTGRTQTIFDHGIKNKESYIKNYLEGLLYVRTDSMLKDIFSDKNNYLTVKSIESKLYELKV